LLPTILQRMEAVLAQSMKDGDAKTAYETLRVYKLLHDKDRYHEGRRAGCPQLGAQGLGAGRQRRGLRRTRFDGGPCDSAVLRRTCRCSRPSLPNEALVRAVQDFLNSNTSTQRVYERAKAAMLPEAPQEFTLVRAVGPQAGTVFSRAGGLPLEKGVPGLFTYDGYHEVFSKRLPEFVGRPLTTMPGSWGVAPCQRICGKFPIAELRRARKLQNDPLLDDIRRQYLSEYAQHWEAFLESIRTVGGSDTTGTSLGFDLSVLRQFAAPDSPLARLARAAARETTLSRPLVVRTQEEKGFLDKASDELSKQTSAIGRNLGIRAEERLEKQIVDNRFAALREVVTGQPDIGNRQRGRRKAGARNDLGPCQRVLHRAGRGRHGACGRQPATRWRRSRRAPEAGGREAPGAVSRSADRAGHERRRQGGARRDRHIAQPGAVSSSTASWA
jgi:type VI secretion system protein ImpL